MDALLAQGPDPAIQVNISAVVGYLMLAGVFLALITLVGILLSIKRQTGELWEAHLGPRALGADGIPRWYTREQVFIDALDRVDKTMDRITTAITSFTDVQRELIVEFRLDRVERKTRAKAAHNPPGAPA